jgi:hypothetical protein
MAWYLTRFYTNGELSLRLALYWSANSMGTLSLPVAAAPLTLYSWYGRRTSCIGHSERPHRPQWLARLAIPLPHWCVRARTSVGNASLSLTPYQEGLMTIVVAIFAFLVLPAAPMDGGRSPVGRIMSSREAEILAARAIRDDPKKAFPRGTKVALADVLDTFKDWRLNGHCAAALLSS